MTPFEQFLVGVCLWVGYLAAARPEPSIEYEPTLLSQDDRLTPDESWQLRNFGIIRKDFTGWLVEGVVKSLLK